MESVIWLAVLAASCWWYYKSGNWKKKPNGLQCRSPTPQTQTTLTLTAQIDGMAGLPFGAALRADFR